MKLTEKEILTILQNAHSVPLGSPMWESSDEYNKLVKIIETAVSHAQKSPLDDLFYYNQGFNDCLAKMVDAKSFDEDEFNHIAYKYRSWPAHDPKGVSERYQELVNHVKSITVLKETAKPLSDEKIRELADKHLDYIAYDEGEYGFEVEIIGELAFYDAIIEEINKNEL